MRGEVRGEARDDTVLFSSLKKCLEVPRDTLLPAMVSAEKALSAVESASWRYERELRRRSASWRIDSVRFTVRCAFPNEYVYVASEKTTETTEIALDTRAVVLRPT